MHIQHGSKVHSWQFKWVLRVLLSLGICCLTRSPVTTLANLNWLSCIDQIVKRCEKTDLCRNWYNLLLLKMRLWSPRSLLQLLVLQHQVIPQSLDFFLLGRDSECEAGTRVFGKKTGQSVALANVCGVNTPTTDGPGHLRDLSGPEVVRNCIPDPASAYGNEIYHMSWGRIYPFCRLLNLSCGPRTLWQV